MGISSNGNAAEAVLKTFDKAIQIVTKENLVHFI